MEETQKRFFLVLEQLSPPPPKKTLVVQIYSYILSFDEKSVFLLSGSAPPPQLLPFIEHTTPFTIPYRYSTYSTQNNG